MDIEEEFKNSGFNNGILRDPKKLIQKAKEAATELNQQQREFCHAMLTAESQAAAALAAGYAPSSARITASRLLTIPAVQEYIGILGVLRSQATAIDATEIVSLQLKTYYEATEAGDYKAANTALDQLAKMSGIYNRVGKLPSPKEIKNQTKAEAIDEITKMTELLNSATNRKQTS